VKLKPKSAWPWRTGPGGKYPPPVALHAPSVSSAARAITATPSRLANRLWLDSFAIDFCMIITSFTSVVTSRHVRSLLKLITSIHQDQAPAYVRRSAIVNVPLTRAMGSSGFQLGCKYK
jgi:hypothetical protein